MVKDNFPIRLKEARLMMGFSMDKLVERAGGVSLPSRAYPAMREA